MKRVLIIQPALPSYRVDLIERLMRRLEAEGDELWVHCAARDYLGVRTAEQLPSGLRYTTKLYLRAFFLKKTPISVPIAPLRALLWADVVVVPGHLHELEVMLSAILIKLRGRRLIWWGSFPTERSLKRRVRLWVAGRCDGIAAYMPSQREGLPTHLQARTRSLNNGLKPLDSPPLRPKLSERPRAIAVIGRASPKSKILPWLLELDRWKGDHLTIHLIGTSAEELMQAQVGSFERISIEPHGYVEGEESLLKILSKCRVSFYPGAVGLSLMEGMRAGLPTLLAAPPAPHMPEFEIFVEGEHGRLFESEAYPTPDELRAPWPKALDEMLSDEPWLDEAQARCLARGEAFSTKVMAERFCELIYAR